ncbi:hypothetical protein GOP47_0016747 [Adiantum capillus-veneris]|uniref:Uncharacterized protein n=1 Tax=Adiantum capillus-veneris TaxID=13818 RepID=A0A9D4UIM9_ADICA|nr:hypothetical protein GOP47_0016747 [Adiantum capillus-veneris]
MCHYGLESNLTLANHVVPMFVDCGSLLDAQKVFNQMAYHTEHSWTSLIQGFQEGEEWEHGFSLYQEMLHQNAMQIMDSANRHWTASKGMWSMELVRRAWSVSNKCNKRMQLEGVSPDVFTWNTVMAGYIENDNPERVFELYTQMQEQCVSPNEFTLINMMASCGNTSALQYGQRFHAQVVGLNSSVATGNLAREAEFEGKACTKGWARAEPNSLNQMAEGEVPSFCLLPVDVGENGSVDSGCTGTCDVFSTRACDATSAQDLRAPATLCGGGSNLLCGGDSAPISATGSAPLCVGSLDVISRDQRSIGNKGHSLRAGGRKNSGFLVTGGQLEEELVSLGESSTKQKDNWARKKFDEWRKICGLECQVPLEKLDLRQLNDMLSQFFVVVCRQNGSLFPSDTLMGMLRCFGRMIKKEQELRVALTGVTEVPFDIVKNPIFKSTQNAVISAMRRSVARGVCKERKKSSVLGVTLEQEILRDIDFSIQHSRGCQSRFAFFCMLHFCVRGGLELYKLERAMFARGADELGPFVRFSERLSKNYKLMRHMPPIVEGDKNLLHVFLQPISSPRTQTWYNRNRVSVKVLSGLVKFICERPGVGCNFSNKSLRSTSVTRMSLGQVPPDVGMLVTGHKRATSYEKYDLSSEVRIAAAQDILSHPYDDSGKLKAYPQVLKEKFNNFCQNVEGASRDIREDVCPLNAGLLSVGSVDNNVGGESKSKISCGHLSNSVDKVASGKSKLKSSDGICFGSYKLGMIYHLTKSYCKIFLQNLLELLGLFLIRLEFRCFHRVICIIVL